MKKLVILALPVALAACGGGASWRDNITPDTNFKIESANVNLESKCPAPGFMTQGQLADEFTRGINKTFCAVKTCVAKADENTVTVIPRVDYKRTMMGEAVSCSESFAGSSMAYGFDLKKNGEIFYSRQPSGNWNPDRGMFGNLGRIATQLSFTGGVENEKSDVTEHLAPGLGKQIAKDLGK
ncbi:MAG: hypothetical protein FWG39_02340 [Alphaproteobacteria bacterium]|nr:hypothetical protein [Alphaproteobacteria bacterium]